MTQGDLDALALLASGAGVEPLVEAVDAGLLRWDETPPDAELQRVVLGELEAYLHERRGTWGLTWSMSTGDPQPLGPPFVGVVADALVFALDAPDWLRRLTWSQDRIVLDVGYKDGMCGSPVYLGNGVAKWGPFPYLIPEFCAQMVFEAAPEVTTLLLSAVDAAADGPRYERIANRS